ncbi:MAG: NUDIX hydrolase [Candidatus Aureabacteria bacterium]|nr:NUDIX hydrolase [Candidatus Auribacterota bacterium]
MLKELKNCLPYRAWHELLKQNKMAVRDEKLLWMVPRSSGKAVLFAFLDICVETGTGVKMPPFVLIRGHAVVIIPILKEKESGECHVILVKQLRAAGGGFLYELPAGMLDEEIHDPAKVAVREFDEEVGLPLGDTVLHPINTEPLYTSPGLLDEGIFYFYFEKELCRSEIRKWNNKINSNPHENEHIEVLIIPFEQAFDKIRSIPALYGLAWYQIHKMGGFP